MDKIIIIGMMDSRKDEIAEYLSKQADFETEITKLIKKIKNKTFAIRAAVPAMIPKPRTPAMIAIRRNVTTIPSMFFTSFQ